MRLVLLFSTVKFELVGVANVQVTDVVVSQPKRCIYCVSWLVRIRDVSYLLGPTNGK